MNIEKHIENLRNENNGKSFSFLAERCETSVEAPYRIKVAKPLRGDDTVVLCLGGNGGDKINLRGYNALLKKVAKFVEKDCDDEAKVVVACSEFGDFHNHRLARKALHYKVSWPKHYEELKRSVSQKYYKETFEPKYIDDIFKEVLEKRIVGDNGKRLELELALRNIRRVNIVAHCHGSYVAMMLEEKLGKRMEELGYSLEEQNKVKEHLLVVAYNPDCPFVVSEAKFVGIVSSQDRSNRYNNYMKEWLLMEPKDFGVMYMPSKWGRTFMCDRVSKDDSEQIIKIDENFDFLGREKRKVGEHEFLGFESDESMSGSAVMLQRFGANILANGVKNSVIQDEKYVKIPNIEQLAVRSFKDRVEFAKAIIVGYRLEQKLYKVDKKKIDNYANMRRSIPTVVLD